MTENEIQKAILEIKAIQMARLCSAQENHKNPVVNIDDRANKALEILINLAHSVLKAKGPDIDWEMIEKDIAPLLDLNIHGHINHPNPKKRLPVVSRERIAFRERKSRDK